MSFYSLGYRGAMDMPIRAFWLMSESIARIEAERRRQALEVAVYAQNGESATELAERLQETVGEVVRRKSDNPMAATMDRDGFEWLRNS